MFLKFLCGVVLVCGVGRDLTWAKGEGLAFLSPPAVSQALPTGIETPLAPKELARILMEISPEETHITIVTHKREIEIILPKWAFLEILALIPLWASVVFLLGIVTIIDIPLLEMILGAILFVLSSLGGLVIVTGPTDKLPSLTIEKFLTNDQTLTSEVFL